MTALIVPHPSSNVQMDDPRDPPVRDPYAPMPESPTDEQWERLAVQNGLYELIRRYGAKRVAQWVRTLAHLQGEEV